MLASIPKTAASMPRVGSRRWVLAGAAASLALALVAIFAIGLSDGNAGGEPVIVYGDALDQFSAETASDVVSWADQVSVVTAVAASEIPEEVPPERKAAGEGLINRDVTFRVDRTIWNRDGVPNRNGRFEAVEFGWVLQGFERTPFTSMGSPWIEVGSQYLMPLAYDRDKWGPILPSAVFAYQEGHVRPVEYQSSALAKQLSGASLDQSEVIFRAARPDPLAAKHFDLQPTARQDAVIADSKSETGK